MYSSSACCSFVVFFSFSLSFSFFFFQAEDGIRDLVRSRGLGDVYKRQVLGAIPVQAESRLVPDRLHITHTLHRSGTACVGYLQGSLTSWTDTEFVGVHYRISWIKYSLGSHDFCFFHCKMKLF